MVRGVYFHSIICTLYFVFCFACCCVCVCWFHAGGGVRDGGCCHVRFVLCRVRLPKSASSNSTQPDSHCSSCIRLRLAYKAMFISLMMELSCVNSSTSSAKHCAAYTMRPSSETATPALTGPYV